MDSSTIACPLVSIYMNMNIVVLCRDVLECDLQQAQSLSQHNIQSYWLLTFKATTTLTIENFINIQWIQQLILLKTVPMDLP